MICISRQVLLGRGGAGGGGDVAGVGKKNALRRVRQITLIIYNSFIFNNLYFISDSVTYN
jgi:hypothetical protein